MALNDANYLKVMENLFCEYESSSLKLEQRISVLSSQQKGISSKSDEYAELYNRIRRLKRCLEDTRAWQLMIRKYLVAGGMSDEEIDSLVD